MSARISVRLLGFPVLGLILCCAGCPTAEAPAPEPRARFEPRVALRIDAEPAAPAAKPVTTKSEDALATATAPQPAAATPSKDAVVPAVATVPKPATGATATERYAAEVARLVTAPQKLTPGRVKKVVDGDTVWLEDGTKLRLIGINTPEKGTPMAAEAEKALAALVLDREVGLEWDVERRDTYKRSLAYIYLDGTLVNGMMVRGGYAHCYRWEPNVKHATPLLALQKAARAEKLGIWALPAPAAASEYLGGSRDHMFHRPECSTSRRYTEGQRRSFATRDAAYDDGRKPHPDCNP